MELFGSTVYITGAASGLGAATAHRFRSAGATLGLIDRNANLGAQLADELGAAFAACDVASADEMEAAFAALDEAVGPPRVLVSCAGIGGGRKVVGRRGPHTLDEFERVVSVNLVGTFNAVRLAAYAMSELSPVGDDGERGVIITTASIAATDGVDGGVAYSASKGGVLGMTLPLARDLAPWAIRAVSISPGSFETPLVSAMPDEFAAAMAESTPFPPRFGQPDEFARLCEHIVGNTMLNGTDIRLDGGIRMAPSRLR